MKFWYFLGGEDSQVLFNTLVRVFARLYAKTCDGGRRARYAPPPPRPKRVNREYRTLSQTSFCLICFLLWRGIRFAEAHAWVAWWMFSDWGLPSFALIKKQPLAPAIAPCHCRVLHKFKSELTILCNMIKQLHLKFQMEVELTCPGRSTKC